LRKPAFNGGAALIERISAWYGALLTGLLWIANAFLFAMMIIICADVVFRNMPWLGLQLRWANQVSEYVIYGITFLAAPWLLRRGQHVRVDIVLNLLPPRAAWLAEWVVDAAGIAISAVSLVYATHMLVDSFGSGAMVLKELVFPEWWILLLVPFSSLLLCVEFLFRMQRLAAGEIGMRDEATSTG